MASIERTAYPRFKSSLSPEELRNLYDPTDEERAFALTRARGADQQLALPFSHFRLPPGQCSRESLVVRTRVRDNLI